MSDTCDRCGNRATEVLITGEAYCWDCAEWRADIELESHGLDTSSPVERRETNRGE